MSARRTLFWLIILLILVVAVAVFMQGVDIELFDSGGAGETGPSEVLPLTADGSIPEGYMLNADGTNLVRIPAGFEIDPGDPQKMIPLKRTTVPKEWTAILGDTKIYRTNTGSSNFRYNTDNLDLTYHAVIPDETIYDISMNYVKVVDPSGAEVWIARAPPQAPPFYYDLATQKYDPGVFVPTYEESRIMSHVRGAPREGRTVGVSADEAECNQAGLCYSKADAANG